MSERVLRTEYTTLRSVGTPDNGVEELELSTRLWGMLGWRVDQGFSGVSRGFSRPGLSFRPACLSGGVDLLCVWILGFGVLGMIVVGCEVVLWWIAVC